MEEAPHIAILPSPGMGHLIPFAEFACRLVHRHNFSVTVIVPTTTSPPSKPQKSVLQALPETINHIFLPPVYSDNFPGDIKAETQISLTMTLSLPSLRDTIKSLKTKTRLVALIADPFGTDAFDIAKEFNISPYLFFLSNAMTLSFAFYLPKLDEIVTGEFRDLPDPIMLPGCVPVHGKDLVDAVQDRSNDAYKWLVEHSKQYSLAEGILVNSFMELEEGAIKALEEDKSGRVPPVYPIGPVIQTGSSDGRKRSECLDWLDSQPCDSVLFVSFGSGGTLSFDQINELALGLEMSCQRFLWVVRSPNDKASNCAFFGVQNQNDPLSFLPKEFLNRVKGRGLVVPSWAPQLQILSHDSTGGFLTHCGWNSILESIVHGVPLIAWPLYGEQKMNAAMLTEGLNVALRPRVNENGVINREEIKKVVKCLMEEEEEEGKRIRNKLKKLQMAAMKASGENGSSTKSLSNLVTKWKNQK